MANTGNEQHYQQIGGDRDNGHGPQRFTLLVMVLIATTGYVAVNHPQNPPVPTEMTGFMWSHSTFPGGETSVMAALQHLQDNQTVLVSTLTTELETMNQRLKDVGNKLDTANEDLHILHSDSATTNDQLQNQTEQISTKLDTIIGNLSALNGTANAVANAHEASSSVLQGCESDSTHLVYKGYVYRTRDHADLHGRSHGCEDNYDHLPDGYEVVPHSDDLVTHVVATRPWDTDLIVFEDGSRYRTTNCCGPAGQQDGSSGGLNQNGDEYAVNGCYTRILVRRPCALAVHVV